MTCQNCVQSDFTIVRLRPSAKIKFCTAIDSTIYRSVDFCSTYCATKIVESWSFAPLIYARKRQNSSENASKIYYIGDLDLKLPSTDLQLEFGTGCYFFLFRSFRKNRRKKLCLFFVHQCNLSVFKVKTCFILSEKFFFSNFVLYCNNQIISAFCIQNVHMNIEYSGSLFYTEIIIKNRIVKLKQYACLVLFIVFINMVTLLIVFLDVFNIFRFGPEKKVYSEKFCPVL